MINLNKGVSTPIAITIIIVLVVITAGIALGYQYYWLPEQETRGEVKTSETETEVGAGEETPTETPTDETANWKTYTNEEYGFEVKYPKEMATSVEDYNAQFYLHYKDAEPLLKISKNGFSFLIGFIDRREITAEDSIKDSVWPWISCSVPYYSRYSGLTISQLIDMDLSEIKENNNFVFNREVWGECATGRCWTGIGYRIDHNDMCYKLILADSTEPENVKIFNQILSTFKFTD